MVKERKKKHPPGMIDGSSTENAALVFQTDIFIEMALCGS